MTADNQPSRYLAYLLRCWQEHGQQEAVPAPWRFSLEDPHSGRRYGFATLEALVAALQRELGTDDARADRTRHTAPPDEKND